MPTVYLAGPISGQTYAGATDWREYAICRLAEWGIVGLSPMRGKAYLSGETRLADHYPEHVACTVKGITCRDIWDVRRCDVVLINLLDAKEVSIGSMLELGGGFVLNKPVVLCMQPGNPHWHGMVLEMGDFRVDTLDDGLDVVRMLLGSGVSA